MIIKTVKELREFLAALPDDTKLARYTQGYYHCLRAAEVDVTYDPKYDSAIDGLCHDDYEKESRRDFDGQAVLFLDV